MAAKTKTNTAAVSKPRGAAARRREKSKQKYKRYYVFALLLVLAVGIGLSLTVFFRIESIVTEGSSRYSDAEIIEASGIETGDNLFRIGKSAIEKSLVEGFPYIESVKIRRSLPNLILITVTEAVPEASIETESGHLLLSKSGRVLEDDVPVTPDGWPRVIGFDVNGAAPGSYLPESEAERYALLMELQEAIRAEELKNIVAIDLTDTLELWLLYDGRIAIGLGSKADIVYKIRSAKNVVDSSTDGYTVGLIDVTTRPVARLREMNIYAEEEWPMSAELLEDYKRAISKPQMMPEKK